MPRINPWGLPKPVLRCETRTLVDADTGFEVCLTLKQIDPIQIANAASRTQEYDATYGGDSGIPLVLPATDGSGPEARMLPNAFFSQVAILQEMEVPEPGDDPADLLWWAGIATRLPSVFGQISEWMAALMTHSSAASKNGQRTPPAS